MKHAILSFSILILSATCLLGFSPSEYYNVSANSGLNLRVTPGNGFVIKKLYLGDRVEIVEDIDCLGYPERIEWVDGEWLRVKHDGDFGYVFSGYLTSLPIPYSEGEYTNGLSILRPFEAWIENNFDTQAANDTLIGSTLYEAVEELENGFVLKKTTSPSQVHLKFTLDHVTSTELYHVLFAMLANKSNQRTFLSNSLFVESARGEIEKISVQHSNESILITVLRNGKSVVEITHQLNNSIAS